MSNQVSDYITLKSISDRFKEVALSITDAEIKNLIMQELKVQIREQVTFGQTIAEWVDTMLEDDESWVELISSCMRKSIEEKFR